MTTEAKKYQIACALALLADELDEVDFNHRRIYVEALHYIAGDLAGDRKSVLYGESGV